MSETFFDSTDGSHTFSRRSEFFICLILFLGTLFLFGRACENNFLDYDDPDYVTQNPHVRDGITFNSIHWAFVSTDAGNWHPITWLSHELDWQLSGNNPRGHHTTNIILHAFSAMLAFLVFRRLTRVIWTSAICAALFAWHPLRVESVAWISERKDVLSVFFGLITLNFYAKYAQSKIRNQKSSITNYLLALIFFALGLMSKPMLVTLPFLFVLLDFWPLRRFNHSNLKRLSLEKIPFLFLSVASCVITYIAQKNGGAVVETFSLNARLENAVISVAAYLGNFFWPFNLAVGYPLPNQWPISNVISATLLVLVITGIGFWQWQPRPWLIVGWFWFLGTLLPVIGLVQVGIQARADRYTYLPTLGLQLALLWTLREFFTRLNLQKLAVIAASSVLVGCTIRTWNQLGVWKNSETLYEHALTVTKSNYLAHCYLGSTLFNAGRYTEAETHFRDALNIKPDYVAARHRLGLALEKLGRSDEAIQEYAELLKIRPDNSDAHYSLGLLLLQQNQLSEAATHFQRVLQIKPDSVEAHYNLANTLIKLHHENDALSQYEIALHLDPGFEKARANYANLLRKLGQADKACAQYRLALAADANDARVYYGLGAALEDLGRSDEALTNYYEAIRLNPDLADAQYNIGTMLLNRNRPAEAATHFQNAAKSHPDYGLAYVGLGFAAMQLGRTQEAINNYEQALRLNAPFPHLPELLARARTQINSQTSNGHD